jgi:hypothetical protein
VPQQNGQGRLAAAAALVEVAVAAEGRDRRPEAAAQTHRVLQQKGAVGKPRGDLSAVPFKNKNVGVRSSKTRPQQLSTHEESVSKRGVVTHQREDATHHAAAAVHGEPRLEVV